MSQTKAQLLAPIGIITGPGLDVTTASGTTFQLGSTGIITAVSANFSGNVTVGGTLTYEDVTNIDSVGVITARDGINVTTGDIDVISGSIGIGTVTPANLLDIHGANGAGGLRLTETNHTNLNRHGRIFEYAGGLYFQSRNDAANGDFIFRGGLDSVEKLRIGSSSQIGIGGANYGTSGQVLTSGGASAAPQWADAGGGAWNLLSTITPSGTSFDVPIPQDGAYDEYAIKLINVANGSYFKMFMKFKLDGNATTAAGYYGSTYGSEIRATGNVTLHRDENTSSGYTGPYKANNIYGACGTMFIYQPTNTLHDKVVFWPQMFSLGEQGSAAGQVFYGAAAIEYNNSVSNKLTHITFFQDSGTPAWNSGKVKVYGIT